MSLKLKLKPNPTIDAILQLRPRIRLKEFLANNANNPYNEFDEIRRLKILDYYERQKQRTEVERAKDYDLLHDLDVQLKQAHNWKRWNR